MTILSTNQQINYVTFAPIVFGIVSMIGSSMILVSLFRTFQMNRQQQNFTGSSSTMTRVSNRRLRTTQFTTFHRIMTALSISDILFSFAWAMGPLGLPSDWTEYWPRAVGNQFTCTAQGFLFTIGIGSYSYTVCLMIYYLLVIRFAVPEERIEKRVEPWMHFVVFGYHWGLAIAGVWLELLNPRTSYCWFAAKPFFCNPDEGIECERGDPTQADFIDEWFLTVLTLIEFAIIFVILLVILQSVWTKYRRSREHAFGGQTQERSRQVMLQCFLYGFNALNMAVWSNLGTIFEMAGDDNFHQRNFWVICLVLVFLPGQGIFNAIIYFRPRYNTIRSQYPSSPMRQIWKEALWYPMSTKQERAERFGILSTSTASSNINNHDISKEAEQPLQE